MCRFDRIDFMEILNPLAEGGTFPTLRDAMTLLDMTSLDTTWLVTFLGALGTKALAQIPWALGLAAFFTILSLFPNQACNPNKPWWRNPGLLTDTHYLFLHSHLHALCTDPHGGRPCGGAAERREPGQYPGPPQQEQRTVGQIAVLGAGRRLCAGVGFHPVLDPSPLPQHASVAVSRGPSLG